MKYSHLLPETIRASAFILLLSCIFSCSSEDRLTGYTYYRLSSNPTTLDPALIVDVTGGSIAAKIFNGLVRLDKDMGIVPDLAERWEVRDNGRTYVFRLRQGVTFSNGREVTSEDFRYSFKRVLDPQGRSPNTWVLDKVCGAKEFMEGKENVVEGIETPDRYTLKIRLSAPFSPFLGLLTMTAAYVVPAEEVSRWGRDFSSHPSGTGPFVLSRWSHGSQLILERNDSYFSGTAKVRGIVYRVIPEDLTAVTEFELGNIDVLTIPASEYPVYKNSAKWKDLISSVNGINTYYLGFICSRQPFDNPELRRAVAYSIDRKKILDTFYERKGRPADGPVPDILRKWPSPQINGYDPHKAREMIERLGMKGKTINFFISSDREVVDIAEIIQSYMKDAGLEVKIKQLEWSAYKEAINNAEPDMFWLGWWADYPDPENFLFPLFHSSNHGASGNRTRYTSREVDRLIATGQRTIDQAGRNRLYMEAENIIVSEMPWVFFWHRTDFTVRQPGIKNYQIYPVYSMDKGLEVSF